MTGSRWCHGQYVYSLGVDEFDVREVEEVYQSRKLVGQWHRAIRGILWVEHEVAGWGAWGSPSVSGGPNWELSCAIDH
jgi:hypothetical protein